jgi:plasmid segregation protein ParM
MINVRPVSVDIGNYGVKALFNGLGKENEVYIQNVIAQMKESREVVEIEKNLIDGLHVEILSGALKKGKGIYGVGTLATTIEGNDELTEDSKKSDSDQPIVMLLTTLAYDAVKNFPEKDGIIEATYLLSTGLPLAEAKTKGIRKAFKEKLQTSQHEVRFLDVPHVSGKKVRIKFIDVVVNTEGHAAMIDLTTNDDGSIKNEDLTQMTILIQDIGGLSTDGAILTPKGVDNQNSDGINKGVSPYLDEIIQRVEREFGYRIKSRAELVEVLTTDKTEEKNHIYVKGSRKSIKAIADDVLEELAREEYKLTKRLWSKVPSVRQAYYIGGGATTLKPYIEAMNTNEEELPIKFVDSKASIWMIARAYYKVLMIYVAQKGIELEVAADKE